MDIDIIAFYRPLIILLNMSPIPPIPPIWLIISGLL